MSHVIDMQKRSEQNMSLLRKRLSYQTIFTVYGKKPTYPKSEEKEKKLSAQELDILKVKIREDIKSEQVSAWLIQGSLLAFSVIITLIIILYQGSC